MKKRILLLIFLSFQIFAFAQQDAWIYLTDKENVAASISNPITILSQQSIDRKNAHGIVIDASDVPVNENYIAQLKSQPGITVKAKSKWFNAVHVRGTETVINALETLSFVDYIDYADKSLNRSGRVASQQDKFQLEETFIDFTYGTTQNQVEMINIDALHALDYTGEGIVIAVLDAGFPNVNTISAFQRLRDNGKLLNGYDFVNRNPNIYAYTDNSHGTNVLSTMGGYIQNQYVGTAPDASYYLFRTEAAETENPVEESYWVEAAERADSLGVHVINSSLGYTTYDNPNYSYTPAQMDGQTAFITRGANRASEKGILVVNSAGNSGNDSWQVVGVPADGALVFTIGGVDADGNYASFSSQGSPVQPTQKPDIVARAKNTFVISEDNTIVNYSGTSFSSPIIAGAMACLMQALPDATIEELKQLTRASASQFTTPDYFLGYGIPDFGSALTNALALDKNNFDAIRLYPNPVGASLFLKLPENAHLNQGTIYDLTGKMVVQKITSNSFDMIDVSMLASGLYILNLQFQDAVFTYKFLKE